MLLARLMPLMMVLAFAIGVGLLTHSAQAQRQVGVNEEQPQADRDGSGEQKVRHTLNKHTQAVVSVAFSPDGKTVASASHDKTVKLWDVTTGKERVTLQGHSQAVVSVAFSPDGKSLASASTDGTVRLWDLASGKGIRTFAGHLVAYAPDGKTLASAEAGDRTVRLWDVASGKEIRAFAGHPCGVYSVVFAADGKTLAAAGANPGGRRVLLWHIASGKEIHDFAGIPNSVTFAPDGKALASAGADGRVQLWDVISGKEIRAFAGHRGPVHSVAYAPDGKTLASAGGDGTMRLWDVASGKEIRAFTGHRGPVQSVAYAPDGKTLASVESTSILIWDASSFSLQRRPIVLAPRELVGFWDDLVNEDMPRSFAAVDALIQAPGQSVPFLGDRVKPIAAPDPHRLAQLISNLDSKEFAVRQKASQELEQLGELAEPVLRGALEGNQPLEVRQRVETLLEMQKMEPWEGERLRLWRVTQVLEGIGTPEAQAVLKTLAGGAPGSRLTQEAKASFERLARRSAASP